MSTRKSILSAVLAILLILSCRSRPEGSEVRITNPIPAGDSFPEVIRLDGVKRDGAEYMCSGIFITPQTVLTAAHCLFDEYGERVPELNYVAEDGTVYKSKMYPSPDYKHWHWVYFNSPKDLAVLDFGKDIATKVAKISAVLPKVDDAVTIVGYGRKDAIQKIRGGKKNFGHNNIARISGSQSIIVGYSQKTVPNEPRGFQSSVAAGDSGGAMFDAKGELVGVISAGGILRKLDENDVPLADAWINNISHPDNLKRLEAITDDLNKGRHPGDP